MDARPVKWMEKVDWGNLGNTGSCWSSWINEIAVYCISKFSDNEPILVDESRQRWIDGQI